MNEKEFLKEHPSLVCFKESIRKHFINRLEINNKTFPEARFRTPEELDYIPTGIKRSEEEFITLPLKEFHETQLDKSKVIKTRR